MALPKPDLFERVDPDARRSGALVVARDLSTADRAARPDPDSAPPDVDPYGRFGPGFPINVAKVQRPALRDDTLARPRLLDWLAANIHHRVVFITAEAGYGKTTLLADFARRTRLRLLWYRIDEQDRDWIGLLNYLVAAGREVKPDFASRTGAMLEDLSINPAARDRIFESFLTEIQALRDVPTALVMDDWHLIDASDDVRALARALIRQAPEGMSFVFASRRRPSLSVARYRALGEVAELTTGDLRFRSDETERLFRASYRHPLEADLLAALTARTEGWAALLQLVRSAIRNRSTAEGRNFIRSLSGVDQDLYDYLAEEVIGDLSEGMQQFLMRTSILQNVTSELACIVMESELDVVSPQIEEAERLGLLARRSAAAHESQRYHVLVRDFLTARLQRAVGVERVTDLHRLVARHADGRDWRLATYHFAAAGEIAGVHRVLESSVLEIMSTGDYAEVSNLLARFPPRHTAVIHDIVRSRLALSTDNVEESLTHARAASALASAQSPHLFETSQLNVASILYSIGRANEAREVASSLSTLADDPHVQDIATAYLLLLDPDRDGSLNAVAEHLLAMASRQRDSGRQFFAGVSYLNAAITMRAMGDPKGAFTCGSEAYGLLDSDPMSPEQASAASVVAWACAALGLDQEFSVWTGRALSVNQSLAIAESLIEAADNSAWFGNADAAERSLEAARQQGKAMALRASLLSVSETTLALRQRNSKRAALAFKAIDQPALAVEIGMQSRLAYTKALLAWETRAPTFLEDVQAAIAQAERQQAGLWLIASRALAYSVAPGTEFSTLVSRLPARQQYVLSMWAEVVIARLSDLDTPALMAVQQEMQRRPERWRPVLRAEVRSAPPSRRLVAASLLESIGEREDILLLRTLARSFKKDTSASKVGAALSRRLAPRVHVEDQGRVRLRVGSEWIEGSAVRRKVLALTCFLLSRPSFSAAKDQVLEALWPDLEPDVAANSLNQTVYFLRRVFEPDYKDYLSAGYVHHESDLVRLDGELVSSRSAHCASLLRSMSEQLEPQQVQELASEYRGKFALDFLYEEWAIAYRDSLHAQYVELVERSARRDESIGQFSRSIELLCRALEVDPDADQLEAHLVHLYRLTGANAAAAERYGHYASVLRRDLGVEPPGLEAM